MARQNRRDIVDPNEIGCFHAVQRNVRDRDVTIGCRTAEREFDPFRWMVLFLVTLKQYKTLAPTKGTAPDFVAT